jgi:hypothetical protein
MGDDHNPTDADLPLRDVHGMVPNVMEGQVDKMSGTPLDPMVSPMGSGILGGPAEGGGDPDIANAMAEEALPAADGADDPDSPTS